MKRTARIITTVAAMALTVAIMCVGVFAATKVTLTSSGSSVSFSATDDVSATVTATKQMGTESAVAITVPNGGVFNPSLNHGQEYSGTVELGNIEFTDVDATYTLTITVENTFVVNANVDAKYTVTCNGDTNGYVVVATEKDGTDFASGNTASIEQDGTATFVTTVKIADDKKDEVLQKGISGVTFGFSLELTKAAVSA